MRLKPLIPAILCLPLLACSPQDAGKEVPEAKILGVAILATTDGSEIGEAKIANVGGVISATVIAGGLEPGERAFHLHSVGICEAPNFVSAGGHLNPMGRAHGSLNPDGQHLGDLPNIITDEDGQSEVTFTFSDDPDQLVQEIFDADGTAVMIHAGPDDYLSDPAGAAGPRIACGVLEPVD